MTELTAAREYIVLALMEAASMYRDGAESFLAEYDAKVRAAALHEATALLGGAFWFDPRDREMAMNTLLGSIAPPPSAVAASEPTCGVLNPKVAATCTEPQDHPAPVHRDAFGNTWPRRDGERPLGSATESAPGCER